MPHRVHERDADFHVDGFAAGRLWLRERRDGKTFAVAVDPETGRDLGRLELATHSFFGPRFLATPSGVLLRVGPQTWSIDAATVERRGVFDGTPLAIAGGRAVMMTPSDELVSVALPGLEPVGRHRLHGSISDWRPLGGIAGEMLVVQTNQAIECLRAGDLAPRARIPLRAPVWDWGVVIAAGQAFAAEPVETSRGPVTLLHRIDADRGGLERAVEMDGRLRTSARGGTFVLLEAERADGENVAVAWRPGAGATAIHLAIGDGGWTECCQIEERIGAVFHRGAVEVFAETDGALRGARVPVPEDDLSTGCVGAGRVFVGATRRLLSVDPRELRLAAVPEAAEIRFDGTAPLVLSASSATASRAKPRPRRNLQVLRESAERFGFPIPPLLARLLTLHDEDPVAARWIRGAGLEISVSGYSDCWIGVDPALLGFAGDGSGQRYALYIYPPQLEKDAGCAIAYWDHETRDVSLLGRTFDDFLARHLARMQDEHPDALRLLLERLGLPEEFPADGWEPPPDWFAAAHGDGTRGVTLAEARAAIDEDPIAGERLLVAYVRENENDDDGIAEMERLYERLGWRFHRENLRQVKHYARR